MVSKSRQRYKRRYKRPRTQVAREKLVKQQAEQAANGDSSAKPDNSSPSQSGSEGESPRHVPMASDPRKRSIDEVLEDDEREEEGQDGNVPVESFDRPKEEIKKPRTAEWTADKTLIKPEGGFTNKNGKRVKKLKADQRAYPEIIPSPQRLQSWVKNVDIQQLVLYILAERTAPSWILVKNRPAIKRVVVLLVPGLSLDLFDGRVRLLPPSSKQNAGNGEDKSSPNDTNIDTPTASSSPAGATLEEIEAPKETEVYDDPNAKQWTYIAKNEWSPIRIRSLPFTDSRKVMQKIFTHIFPTRAGGDNNRIYSPVQNMLKVPLQSKGRKSNKKPNKSNGEKLKLSALLLSPEQMIGENYPIHSSLLGRLNDPTIFAIASEDDTWSETDLSQPEVLTIEAGSVLEGRRILAIDCEMVRSNAGSELARISVVSWNGKTIFDTLVKPDAEVTDYVTQYSGITEDMLRDVSTTLKDVHEKLKELVTPSTVLVGHSLNTDLHAIRFAHPHIVDTSVIYDCARGKPYKPRLKWLANKFLKLEIQKGGSTTGHDSVEDASACLKLLKMKLERGLDFGTQTVEEENIFELLEKHRLTGGVVDYGNPSSGNGYKARLNIGCFSDAEVCAGVSKCVNGDVETGIAPVDFVWGRLLKLEAARNWKSNWQKFSDEILRSNMTASSPPIEIPAIPSEPSPQELSDAVYETVEHISNIYESLPKCTAFIVYSGTGCPQEMARLNAMLTVYRKEFSVKKWDQLSIKWTDDEEQALRKAVTTARKGIAFVTVK